MHERTKHMFSRYGNVMGVTYLTTNVTFECVTYLTTNVTFEVCHLPDHKCHI